MFGRIAAVMKGFLPVATTARGEPVPSGSIRIELEGKEATGQVTGSSSPVTYPDVVVGVVLRRRRAVMLRRIGEAGTMWTFPGGKVEDGETREEAVVRELQEEIGLRCHVVRRIGERVHPVTGRTITYFLCKAEGGKSRNLERNKADDIRWLTPREIETVTNGTLFDKVKEEIAEEARLKR
ncbi:NUDIX domain-containing protein [Pararhizobium sp. BT-229]|uniref:NUDIX domain-containing protein n=1 Tax=Pararhizobium sp. BT-229 TaxID=2986923 RepID=UPI0021F6ED2C|nr:NUDIX domain-containing protein [Pararhizobium sp. BT-229]MCV9964950.1 NUDIX domain-containing protein [Pararhizobium sp. BT-229]